MALASLKHRKPFKAKEGAVETKRGAWYYGGEASEFHEWEYTEPRFDTTPLKTKRRRVWELSSWKVFTETHLESQWSLAETL